MRIGTQYTQSSWTRFPVDDHPDNLYARAAGAFVDVSEHAGLMLASRAAVAFAAVQKLDRLPREVSTQSLSVTAREMTRRIE
jgi:hypothetical protein